MTPSSLHPLPWKDLPQFPRFISIVLVSLFLYCSGAAMRASAQSNANNTSGTARTDTLRGTVVNSVTREPIGRALVYSPDNRFATMTDDRGQFEFSFLHSEPGPPATSVSTFSGRGRVQESRLQYLSSNRPTNLMARKPGFLSDDSAGPGVLVNSDQQTVTIALIPAALVVGHIQLPSADYLDRVEVQLFRHDLQQGREHWSQAGATRSRADGSFRFAELPAGTYKLLSRELLDQDPLTFTPRGQLFGYPPVYFPAAQDFAAAETIRLTAGTNFQANISPVRREYYPVRVGVTNAPSGVNVEVWPHGHPGPGYSLGFNPEEQFIEGSLPDGTYTVRAASYGPAPMTGSLNITVSGGPATGASMMLLPNPSIAVSVTEEFQDPETLNRVRTNSGAGTGNSRRPNYLNVNLIPLEEFGFAPGASLRPPKDADDESLVIEHVQPGSYRVQTNTNVGYISSLTSGDIDLLRKPLLIGPGSGPAIEISVRDDGAQVDGTVDGPAKGSTSRVPAICFIPMTDGGGQFRMTWTYGDGRFQLQQLPPGVYRVLAFDRQRPELEYATEETLRQYDATAQVIHVVAHQKEHLRLPLTGENP